ncbi:disease resistance protein RPM1-like isoform X2 [Chenopodium quinoa]|nr:disease resistance protein RPM1-like isoform X2 [Chenopodium quinoa]
MALAIPIPEKLLSFLLEKVVPVLQAETRKFQSVPELVSDIKNEMDIAKDYLKKVEVKVDRIEDGSKDKLKQVSKLRSLVFKIEDIIDDYELIKQQQLGHQSEKVDKGCMIGMWKILDQSSKDVEGYKDKRGIACSIVRIKNAMEKIKGNGKGYEETIFALGEEDSGKKKLDPGTCPLYKDEENFVGFKERELIVKKKLRLEDEKYDGKQFVLAVWGQPGLGKTTLVQKVYENERNNFSYYAWITATKPYSSVALLKCLFKQFIYSYSSADNVSADSISVEEVQKLPDNEATITDRLRSYLMINDAKKGYLVVLDDVSEMEELSKIIQATLVPSYSKGGRILMTMKSEHNANYWKTSSTYGEAYNLQVLSEEEAKRLFNKKAFGNEGKCPRKLTSLRDKIVKECDGLPFLIEKVGAIFSTTDKWIELYQNFQINPVSPEWSKDNLLFSGYHEMPYHLKPCFLYLCMFPKSCKFKRTRIVRLWIAEGFVEAKDHSTLEEAAEEYLNELVERGMLHLLKSDETGRNRTLILPCMWQHVMFQKLADLSFCQVLTQNRLSTNNQCRRLSIHKDAPNTVIASSVRSILSFVQLEKFPIAWSSPFQEAEFRLKVLDLQNAKFVDVPRVVGKLHNLRYLSMRNTKVNKLPETIGGLWNLQTLDLKNTDVKELPTGINRLHKLRHLLVCHYNEDEKMVPVKIPEGVLSNFKDLQKLAFVDGSLYLPKGDPQKEELQEENSQKEDGSSKPIVGLVPGLDKLTQLRRLAIVNMKKENIKPFCKALENMKQLRSLSVRMLSDEDVLDLSHIKSPPEFLERLYLIGPLKQKQLPIWIHKLKHLVRLLLKNSGFESDPLEKLKVMQELLVLELDNAYDGKVLDFGYKGLRKLQVLRIRRLTNLKTVKAGKNALLQLRLAVHRDCPTLKNISLPPQINEVIQEFKPSKSPKQRVN